MHDDCVIALSLAWEAKRRSKGYYPNAIELQRMREIGTWLALGGSGSGF